MAFDRLLLLEGMNAPLSSSVPLAIFLGFSSASPV